MSWSKPEDEKGRVCSVDRKRERERFGGGGKREIENETERGKESSMCVIHQDISIIHCSMHFTMRSSSLQHASMNCSLRSYW